jgi:hypothetical protein
MFHYEIEPGIEACGVMPRFMTGVLAGVNCPSCLAAVDMQLL